MTPRRVHSFDQSLDRSHSYENAPWWMDVYRQAFPGLASAVSMRKDTWSQRAGIDRIITLNSGRVISIDEKVREREWPDILLERWSDEAAQTPGWIQKQLACEFIAYAFVPIATCHLFPTLALQRAWRLHGRQWINDYPEVRAHNQNGWRSWVTVSVPVPTDVLYHAITDAMKVCWQSAKPKSDDEPDLLLPLFRVAAEKRD